MSHSLLHNTKSALIIGMTFLCASAFAQEEIRIKNPSFEDEPRAGTVGSMKPILGWVDCAVAAFPGESAPDIHPHPDAWQVSKSAVDGRTFLGLVVRQSDTWEFISQAVSSPIQAGQCYEFSIYMAKSEVYMGLKDYSVDSDGAPVFTRPFLTPAVLRVWGGSSFCDKDELLAQSDPVENTNWDIFGFKLEPTQTHRFIILEAYYKTPTLIPYNGHILVDHASMITPVDCDEVLEFIADVPESANRAPEPIAIPVDIPSDPEIPVPDPVEEPVIAEEVPEPEEVKNKILTDLQRNKLSQGQTIRIDNLYFKADSSRIHGESFEVLDEMYHFLRHNPDVVVEIGGHTNTKPSDSYCDQLSTARAKAVRDYLVDKGLHDSQVEYQGYGKRKPLIPDDWYSRSAQRKNQRVEIKILSLGH